MTPDLSQPRVSVIIPNYQHARYLEERIQSVLAQSFRDFEIILLDDASTDGSTAVLERYRDHPQVSHLIVNATNTGKPFVQWRRGLELARGPLIWIAESDDVTRPEFLAAMVQAFDRDPTLGVASAMLEFIDEQGQYLGPVHEDLQGTYDGIDVLIRELGHRNCIRNASAAVFDRALGLANIDQVVQRRYSGDWHFWALLAMQSGRRMHFHPEILCRYRLHGTSVHGKIRHSRRPVLSKERMAIFCDINLRPATAPASALHIRRFVQLNDDIWFWFDGVPPNLRAVLKMFSRPRNLVQLPFVAATLLLDLTRKIRNRAVRLWHAIRGSATDSTVAGP
jgi:glycosyltransferase involved in cell wall biosynthesis